jgi:hypothetical protein
MNSLLLTAAGFGRLAVLGSFLIGSFFVVAPGSFFA